MSIGLFVGRFQPFHKGHLAIIKLALSQVDFLKIVLGSKQKSRDGKNPFTAKEREEMIKAVLDEEGIKEYSITALNDIPDNDAYPNYVKDNVGQFDVVFSGENELVKQLFTQDGYKVVDSNRLNGWMATEIRERIINNQDYKDLVPAKIYSILEKGMKDIILQ